MEFVYDVNTLNIALADRKRLLDNRLDAMKSGSGIVQEIASLTSLLEGCLDNIGNMDSESFSYDSATDDILTTFRDKLSAFVIIEDLKESLNASLSISFPKLPYCKLKYTQVLFESVYTLYYVGRGLGDDVDAIAKGTQYIALNAHIKELNKTFPSDLFDAVYGSRTVGLTRDEFEFIFLHDPTSHLDN